MTVQNFANHTKFVPAFHFFVLPVLILNFGWSIYRWAHLGYSVDGGIWILVSLALLVGFLTTRASTLAVQDRVIRLEERLRFERLLPQDLLPRAAEFTIAQLVALRFASDAEVAALAQKVLDEKLTNRKAIKQLVKDWRADHLRA
jgi:uncharacterized protein DUF6526